MGGVYVKEDKKTPNTHTTPKTKQIKKKPNPQKNPNKQNPQPKKLKNPTKKTWKETWILVCVRNQYNVNNSFFLHC